MTGTISHSFFPHYFWIEMGWNEIPQPALSCLWHLAKIYKLYLGLWGKGMVINWGENKSKHPCSIEMCPEVGKLEKQSKMIKNVSFFSIRQSTHYILYEQMRCQYSQHLSYRYNQGAKIGWASWWIYIRVTRHGRSTTAPSNLVYCELQHKHSYQVNLLRLPGYM